MNPFYQDNHNILYCSDFRKNELPDESIQMVVTSPPYWGLRKYSGEQDLIWGENNCEHEWGVEIVRRDRGAVHGINAQAGNTLAGVSGVETRQGSFCSLCGAWRGSFGLEPTPEMYVQHTIEILREIRRVLRKDGVVFWNLGDSYYASGGAHKSHHANPGLSKSAERGGVPRGGRSGKRGKVLLDLKGDDVSSRNPYGECADCQLNNSLGIGGCPVQEPETSSELSTHSHREQKTVHSDNSDLASRGDHNEGETLGLCSSPELVDGVVPDALESTEPASSGGSHQSQLDPTCSYYQSFQHSASQSNYTTFNLKPKDLCLIPFRVAIAAQEDGWWVRSIIIWLKPNPMPESVTDRPTESHEYILMLTKSDRYYWDADAVREQGVTSEDDKAGHCFGGKKTNEPNSMTCHSNKPGKKWDWTPGRNIRSVWEFPTQPYPEAHFAVFPEKLPEICIKAATPEVGCCAECGAPWIRIIKTDKATPRKVVSPHAAPPGQRAHGSYSHERYDEPAQIETIGWRPTCKCTADKVPSVVLDPFAGAGTTLWVAKKLNRKAIGFDTSEEYCQLAVERLRQQGLL